MFNQKKAPASSLFHFSPCNSASEDLALVGQQEVKGCAVFQHYLGQGIEASLFCF